MDILMVTKENNLYIFFIFECLIIELLINIAKCTQNAHVRFV